MYRSAAMYTFSQASLRRPGSSFIIMMMVMAFVMKAIIPSGFMPESKNGFMEMVICSGMGEKTVLVPNSETPLSEHHNGTTAKEICAYQLLSSGKMILPLPIAALPEFQSSKILGYIADDSFIFSAKSLSFEARGPPSV